MESNTQAASCLTNLVEITDVATSLGISTKQVRNMIARKLLPRPIRIGNRIRWNPKEIESWIEAGCPDCSGDQNTQTTAMEGGVK